MGHRADGRYYVRVLVVDDSAFMRKALVRMIESEPDLEVAGIARNGEEAVAKAKTLKPDVITLDIEMPKMNGLEALKHIRIECQDPRPAILMCSSLTKEGSHEALKALRMGAADVIGKSASTFSEDMHEMHDELVAKIRAIGKPHTGSPALRVSPRNTPKTPARHSSHAIQELSPKNVDIVLIGSSTGGPPILEQILTQLPGNMPVPIVIAQHMPPIFTKSLSERLDQVCPLKIIHGRSGLPLNRGEVCIAPGGMHARVVRSASGRFALEVSEEPKSALYRPSVNELFLSGAKHTGRRCVGVVLTGMGDDGLVGGQKIHSVGGKVFAQTASTCVVYGMPKAVTEAEVIEASMDPDQIAKTISTLAPTALSALSA